MKIKVKKRFRRRVGHYKRKFEDERVIIHLNDCNRVLKVMGKCSVDAIVTDPPYGIRFLNKHWDYDIPSVKTFKRMFRVLKPGGTLLCFASPSTQHRMASNIEDAGFELRDCIMWLFGSGFPKSQNVAELMEKGGGSDRELVERFRDYRTHALKPAYEPIIMAMKPLDGNYAENARKHGISGLNIEGCRLEDKGKKWERPRGGIWKTDKGAKAVLVDNTVGRFPTNLIYEDSDEVRKALVDSIDGSMGIKDREFITRIFYCAKVKGKVKSNNSHPTIKPISLMRYLCRLVKSPSGGIILDPFMGSGSTGVACILEGIRFMGIEREGEYFEIAKCRLSEANVLSYGELLTNK